MILIFIKELGISFKAKIDSSQLEIFLILNT